MWWIAADAVKALQQRRRTRVMPNPVERIQNLVDEFSFFDDWADRYQYLIDLGKQMPAYPADKQDEAHKFHGCQSQVWLHYEWIDNRLNLMGTSDAAIVRGLVALLLRVYDGQTAAEILDTPNDFLDTLGLKTHLSPNRATGIVGMIQKIQQLAIQQSATN